jgi:hypothetical protein
LEKSNPSRLDYLLLEIDELKELWSKLKEIYILLDQVKKTLI